MKITRKLCLCVIAVAGLSGCAVYPAPGYGPYESAGAAYGQPYPIQTSPIVINGSVGYQSGYGPPAYQGGRGYWPGARPGYGPGYGPGPGYGGRDRDGDGVPNRRDARPNNPYQR